MFIAGISILCTAVLVAYLWGVTSFAATFIDEIRLFPNGDYHIMVISFIVLLVLIGLPFIIIPSI